MHPIALTVRGAALVTGGSRGIGRVIATKLGSCGVPVAINYRAATQDAETVVDTIRESGGTAVALKADLAVQDEAADLFRRAEDAIGPLGVIVNNAGATHDRLIIQMSDDDWDGIWSTNLAGSRAVCRAAMGALSSRRSGTIINVGSVVGTAGNAGQANYASAKSAVLGLTREMALHGAPHGVTVNCVVPGYIVTDATAHLTEAQRDVWLSRIPMRRYATPEEVADVVLFFASTAASYITGQCIAVDGGFLAGVGGGLAS